MTGTTDPLGLSRRRRWGSAAILSASMLVITIDLTILNIALPDIAEDLRPSATEILWIIDAYSLALAGLLVAAAAVGDRWGRKRALMSGFALFGVASALVLVASTPLSLIALRVLLGVGGALIMPTTLSLIRTVFTDPNERASALGLWAAVAGVGAAAGPIVGGLLLEHFSWHAAFLVNVPLMLGALVAAWFVLPESRAERVRRWDTVGMLYSLIGMVALVWSVKRFASDRSFVSAPALVVFSVGVLVLFLFVRRCLGRPDPLLEVTLFARRAFAASALAAFGAMFAVSGALLLLVQWLQIVEGLSPFAAGLRLLPLSAVSLLSSLTAASLARRIGARAVLGGGLVVAGVGMVALFLPQGMSTYLAAAGAMALISAGVGSLAVASMLIMGASPSDAAGSAAAIEEVSYDLGNAFGVAVLGSIAAVIYRDQLFESAVGEQLVAQQPSVADAAGESVGNAVALATDLSMPQLASTAGDAFITATQQANLVGGLFLIAVGVGTYLLIPRGTDITHQHG